MLYHGKFWDSFFMKKFGQGIIMKTKEILNQAMNLKPADKFIIIESLITSLDKPDKSIEEIWVNEAEKRLKAYRQGRLKGVPMSEVFSE